LFYSVDPKYYSLFDQFAIDSASYAIDPFMLDDSNVNLPSMYELRLLLLTVNYFGAFFPAIFTSVTCSEDFVSLSAGRATSELYTTNVH